MRTTALLYHDVVPEGGWKASGFQSPDADIYKLDCEKFRRQLNIIAAQSQMKPESVDLAGADDARRHLMLTFDDGGVSALLYTAEMLEEYGWPGHFFMTTDWIGKPGFLDETQLRSLDARKHVIGSHSCSHPPRMAACSASQLDREWRDSVHRLEDILGHKVTTASVPGGYYSRRVASTAAAAGIRVLFTSEPVTNSATIDGCLVIGRFCVQNSTSDEWVSSVIADRTLPKVRRFVTWNGKKLLKAAGGTAWLAFRKAILARRANAERSRTSTDARR